MKKTDLDVIVYNFRCDLFKKFVPKYYQNIYAKCENFLAQIKTFTDFTSATDSDLFQKILDANSEEIEKIEKSSDPIEEKVNQLRELFHIVNLEFFENPQNNIKNLDGAKRSIFSFCPPPLREWRR